MAIVEFLLPSKIPYGNTKVVLDSEVLGIDPHDPEQVANEYIKYFTAFKKAEEAALTGSPKLPSKPAPVAKLDEVLSEADAVDLVVSELGATEVSDEPWNNKPEVAAKPWSPPAADAWDFS